MSRRVTGAMHGKGVSAARRPLRARRGPGPGLCTRRDPCCEATIDTTGLKVRQRRILAVVFAINTVTFLLVTASAFLSGSSSLLSGALDNLGDALTYALSFAVVGGSASAKARVALVKGSLILLATVAVAGQIAFTLPWLFLRSTIRVLGSALRQIREGTA